MKRNVWNLLAIALILSLAAIAWDASNTSVAQDAAKEAKKQAKGRLPNYYADVVDGQQREQIYQIQAKYRPQIQELEEQLAAVEAKQNKEIEGVLRPDQLKQVNERRAAAEAKRKKRRQKRTEKE